MAHQSIGIESPRGRNNKMNDEDGPDAMIVTVSADLRKQNVHFFTHHEDLEPGNHATIAGWGDVVDAQAIRGYAYHHAGGHV
jgi:inorganic pyrophosphatase